MTKFNVPDMSCGHCRATIQKAVTGVDAAAGLDFDMEARTVTVSSKLDDATIAGLLDAEGYPATVAA